MRPRMLVSALAGGLAVAGCADDSSCGPGDAPNFGLVASSADIALTYGDLESGQNNDCTDRSVPDVVISLTLEGTQMGTARKIVFCVPHPDALGKGVPFGDEFRVINVYGEADGCTLELASGTEPTGTARAAGLCDDGASSAGYALTLDGNVMLLRKCAGSMDVIPFHIQGTTSVRLWGT